METKETKFRSTSLFFYNIILEFTLECLLFEYFWNLLRLPLFIFFLEFTLVHDGTKEFFFFFLFNNLNCSGKLLLCSFFISLHRHFNSGHILLLRFLSYMSVKNRLYSIVWMLMTSSNRVCLL